MTREQFHVFIYALKSQQIDKGQMLFEEGQNTDDLIFVEKGCLEIYTITEGNEFILDHLPAGSILNQLVVFTDDLMQVNIRAVCDTHILKFGSEEF